MADWDDEDLLTYAELTLIRGYQWPSDDPVVAPLVADEADRRLLRGTELRYVLVRLLQLLETATVPELIDGIGRWGFRVGGRPSKTIADALRWERRRDRVRRVGRGIYRAGAMPRSTEHRIIWRVVAMREQVAEEVALRKQAALREQVELREQSA